MPEKENGTRPHHGAPRKPLEPVLYSAFIDSLVGGPNPLVREERLTLGGRKFPSPLYGDGMVRMSTSWADLKQLLRICEVLEDMAKCCLDQVPSDYAISQQIFLKVLCSIAYYNEFRKRRFSVLNHWTTRHVKISKGLDLLRVSSSSLNAGHCPDGAKKVSWATRKPRETASLYVAMQFGCAAATNFRAW